MGCGLATLGLARSVSAVTSMTKGTSIEPCYQTTRRALAPFPLRVGRVPPLEEHPPTRLSFDRFRMRSFAFARETRWGHRTTRAS